MVEDGLFQRVQGETAASGPVLPGSEDGGPAGAFLFGGVRGGARQVDLERSVPVAPDDLFAEKTPLRVVAPEPLVVEKVRETRPPDFFRVAFERSCVREVADGHGEGVFPDQVRPHRPVHEPDGLEREVPSPVSQVAAETDGDELRGQPVLVLFPAVGDAAQGNVGRPGDLPDHVESRPAALLQGINPEFTGREKRQVGPLIDDEVLGEAFDHAPLSSPFGRGPLLEDAGQAVETVVPREQVAELDVPGEIFRFRGAR